VKLLKQDTKFFVGDFKKINKYNYATYTRDDNHGPRTYKVNDLNLPSVTNILQFTQSKDKQQGLDKWRERVGMLEAFEITRQAARRGTEMHKVLEKYANGEGYLNLSDEGTKPRLMAHEIIQNLGPLKVVYGTEISLTGKNRWAGSTDVIGEYDGKPTIIDFKQSNKPKREEWVEDYYYQIAAYSLAHEEHYGPIDQGLIAICTVDGLYQEFKMDAVKMDEYENKWLERLERYEKKQEEREAKDKKRLGRFYRSPEERKAWHKANKGKTAEDFMKELEKETNQEKLDKTFDKVFKKPTATS
jgi:genome maintenance exonuclease 1